MKDFLYNIIYEIILCMNCRIKIKGIEEYGKHYKIYEKIY